MEKWLYEHLEHKQIDRSLSNTHHRTEKETISLYGWHQHTGYCSIRVIIGRAKGVVTRVALKELPYYAPNLDSCLFYTLMKAQNTLFKEGHMQATEPLKGQLGTPLRSHVQHTYQI